MIVTVICARLLHCLRYVFAVTLLLLPWTTANRCFGQEKPPQTEDEKEARWVLNQGVQAFRNGQYQEAERYFVHAKELDPRLLNARLYLATTYASQFIPGAPSDENRRLGETAATEFRDVLTLQPDNLSAIDGIGSLLFQMAGQPYDPPKFADAKSQFQKHIQLKPEDPEPHYWVGVIDWTLSFRANGELRARINKDTRGEALLDSEPLPPREREQYKQEYGPLINEGIEALTHAIEVRPGYDDAMAYLNLLYRRKADTVARESEREQLITMADDLVDKIKDIKQKRAEASKQP